MADVVVRVGRLGVPLSYAGGVEGLELVAPRFSGCDVVARMAGVFEGHWVEEIAAEA